MKLIETTAELLPFIAGEDGIYKMIERAGRTCYKSTDKMTNDSAKPFVERMIKSGHTAMLEHGTVYLKVPFPAYTEKEGILYLKERDKTYIFYRMNPYSKVIINRKHDYLYITTNYRCMIENDKLDDLQYLCSPTEFHEKRYTMRFTCSRAIANELVRHRVFSFAQESQRYINYSKERHGGEITFIKPSWLEESEEEANSFMGLVMAGAELNEHGKMVYPFFESLMVAEKNYFVLLNKGFTPQQARDVLPNATKTELIMTGFSSDWRHVVDLRLFEKTGKVHPDMLDLMQKAQKVMQEAGIWDDIIKQPSKFE